MTRALRQAGPPPVPVVNAADPTQLIQYAINRGTTAAELKDLMDLAQRERDRLAAEKFGEALAGFQSEVPQIEKLREVRKDNGEVMYRFAALEDIDRIIQPVKAKHRISTSGTIKQTATGIEVLWVLQVGSHKQNREYVLPLIAVTGLLKGGANATQNLGAWMKYIQRYTYCMALGVVVRDEDTDGNSIADIVAATDEQKAELRGLIEQAGTPMDKFLKFAQRDRPESERDFDTMTQAEYRKVAHAWRDKVAGMKVS